MRSFVWTFIGAVLGLAPSAVQSQASARTILQHFYQASGGSNWQRFEECDSIGTVSYLQKTGTIHYFENRHNGSNRAEIEIAELGVKQSGGNDPIQSWHRDKEGDIQLD